MFTIDEAIETELKMSQNSIDECLDLKALNKNHELIKQKEKDSEYHCMVAGLLLKLKKLTCNSYEQEYKELYVKEFVDYLDNNAFELRHDTETIRKYAEKFIKKNI